MIKIIDLLDGTNMAISVSQATKLVQEIKRSGVDKLELDFDGMEVATTAFFNVVFDYFLVEKKMSLEEFLPKIKILKANDFIKFAFSSSFSIAQQSRSSEKNE